MKTNRFANCLYSLLKITYVVFGLLITNQLSYSQTEEQGMNSKQNNYTTFGDNRVSSPKALPYNAPCLDCEEDLSARTEFTKTYKGKGKDAGKVYTQSGYSPLHIKDQSGNWITFDSRLRREGYGLYTAPDQHSPVTIDLNAGISSIHNADGEIKFNNSPELLWKTGSETISLGKANFSNHTVGDDGVYVTNVWPGIDMEMRVLMGSLKTNFIIKNRPSQTSGVFIIRDEIQLTDGLTLKKQEDELKIEGRSGKEVFSISSCVGYDSHVTRNNGVQMFNYEINGNIIDIVLPLEIINAPEFVYPYTVDPLVNSSNTLAQASITGSAYSATCFVNYCSYNLSVATPANSVIVDALWSFNYVAAGSCWLYDGAITFTTGACASPNQAGFYWFCNGTGTGTCTGTNISMFSDISSCMPTPSCTPQNVPFSMRFYRCYGSATGCSNSCIGAASPWTITLVGRTLEHTNPTSPITVSSTSVCAGQTINASTTGSYGVPPYTYNWSLNPSGTPSAGTGSNATITFPTPGNQTLYSTTTDACGQQVTSSIAITVNPAPTVTITPNPVSICSPASPNITLSSTPAGATFNWTVTQTNVTGASAGSGTSINQTLTASGTTSGTATYSVVGTLAGCPSAPTNVIVTVNPTPTVVATPASQSICSGGTTSIALSSPVSGTSFSWTASNSNTSGSSAGSGASINQTLTNVDGINSGTTTYTITPSVNGCPGTPINVVVTVDPAPTVTINPNPVNICSPASPNITLSSTPTGATFNWTVTQTNVTGASAGSGTSINQTLTASGTTSGTATYSIVGTLAGCPSAPTNVIVTVNPTPTVVATPASQPICSGGTTSIALSSPVSGTSFSWTASNSNTSGSSGGSGTSISQTLTNVDGINSGTTTYTITPSANGCPGTPVNVIVTVNPDEDATFNYSPTTICSSSSNPIPTLNNPGTTGIFSGSVITFVSTATGEIDLASTGPGNYTVTFTTSGACPNTYNQNITIVDSPDATFTYASPFCQNGVNPLPQLGPGAANGTYTASSTDLVINSSTGEIDLQNSLPGTYTITNTIAASGGCSMTDHTFSVTINESPTATISGGGSICQGQPFPNVTIQLTGTGPWTVGLSDGTSTQTLTITTSPYAYQPTQAGNYTITSISGGGCNGTASGNAIVTVNPTPDVDPINNIQQCANTTINVPNFTGSLGGTTYSWTNSSTSIGLGASGNGNIGSFTGTNASVTPVSGTITVTPSLNGCSGTPITFTITIDPEEDATFSYSPSTICSSASNPIPSVNTPGTFSGAGVTFVNTATGEIDLSATGPGNYTITYNTSGNCPDTYNQNITIIDAPDATFTYASPFCQNGVNPLPQLGPGAANGTYTASSTDIVINSSTGEINLQNSLPGTYIITNTIAASGGCPMTNHTFSVTINGNPTATISGGGSICQGQPFPNVTIQLTGTGPWTVGLSDGTSTQTLTITTSPYVYQPTLAGNYTITSVSSATCNGTASGSAIVTVNPTPDVDPINNIQQCANTTVNVPNFTGSLGGTTYSWTNSSTSIGLGASGNGNIGSFTGTNASATPVSGTITVTPSLNGCSGTPITFTITIDPIPSPNAGTNATYCLNDNIANLTATPSSGGLINWYNNANLTTPVGTGNTHTPSSSVGTHTYYVTETLNGCISTPVQVSIIIHGLPIVNAGADRTVCAGTPIILSGSGATNYGWSNGITNGQPFNQPVGSITYTVTGTDNNNCSNTDQVTVTVVSSPNVSVTNSQNVTCSGLANGSAQLSVTGGMPGYTYTWNPSVATGNSASNLNVGNYTVTVTDTIGCTGTVTFTITEPALLSITSLITDANCGFSDGEITLNVTGGNGNYNYLWSPNISSTNTASGLTSGSYNVTVTDPMGCTQSVQMNVDLQGNVPISVSADVYVINEGDTSELLAEVPPGLVYDSIVWSPSTGLSCVNCLDPTAAPTQTTVYYATVYTPDGCSGVDSLIITIEIPCSEVFVPTIFSPNNDGLNDFQCVRGSCIAALEFTIFDRWGEIVFSTTNQENCWNGNFRGKPVQTGVYVYKLSATLDNGEFFSESGNIQVVK